MSNCAALNTSLFDKRSQLLQAQQGIGIVGTVGGGLKVLKTLEFILRHLLKLGDNLLHARIIAHKPFQLVKLFGDFDARLSTGDGIHFIAGHYIGGQIA
ncbi:MAG: hypothetical protein BWY75_03300 [bacterium ADurb.Bin425]|nr:MAG: hypothetical protein BWY75_03300 [bacterium ADurb.Bin425]